MIELCIEFESQHVLLRSDIPAFMEIMRHAFSFMSVRPGEKPLATIEVLHHGGANRITSSPQYDFRDRLPALIDYVKDQIALEFMRSRTDLLWLHAGGAERNGSALVVVGPSGKGKSTLTSILCSTGWNLMADDGIAIDMTIDLAIPYPMLPFPRAYPGKHVTPEKLRFLARDWIATADIHPAKEPARIAAFLFPEFTNVYKAELRRITPGDGAMDLLRSCQNFSDHKEAAVARVAALAKGIQMYRLIYSKPGDVSMLLKSLF